MALFSTHQLFFLSLIFLPLSTLSIDFPTYQVCEKNFTRNKWTLDNIYNILFDMVAKSSVHRYAISSNIHDCCMNSLYGITQCRGDLSVEACSACITNAAHVVLLTCPESDKTLIWYEDCFLRYDTDDFHGKPDKSFADVWISSYVAIDPKAFIDVVGELMGKIMAKTVARIDKFSYGENYVNDKLTVYGMAQCTRDLRGSECNECLDNAMKVMAYKCKEQDGCHIFGSSCAIRYETYKFLSFNSSTDAVASAPSIVIEN